jgi:ribosome recycling factor
MTEPKAAGILGSADERMALTLEAMERDFQKIRVGAASGSLLDAVLVDHHGRRVKLIEIASVSIPDPRQIVIRPWDPASLRAIGTAISQSRIGLTPTIDGGAIRLYVPELSEERRLELVGLVHERMERAKVEIRAVRHEALAMIRAEGRAHRAGSDEVARDTTLLQRLTDRSILEIDRLGRVKQEKIIRL